MYIVNHYNVIDCSLHMRIVIGDDNPQSSAMTKQTVGLNYESSFLCFSLIETPFFLELSSKRFSHFLPCSELGNHDSAFFLMIGGSRTYWFLAHDSWDNETNWIAKFPVTRKLIDSASQLPSEPELEMNSIGSSMVTTQYTRTLPSIRHPMGNLGAHESWGPRAGQYQLGQKITMVDCVRAKTRIARSYRQILQRCIHQISRQHNLNYPVETSQKYQTAVENNRPLPLSTTPCLQDPNTFRVRCLSSLDLCFSDQPCYLFCPLRKRLLLDCFGRGAAKTGKQWKSTFYWPWSSETAAVSRPNL